MEKAQAPASGGAAAQAPASGDAAAQGIAPAAQDVPAVIDDYSFFSP
jgi:hypothetical protein